MKKAARMGFTIVSGSDPLPFTGEEQVMGQYGVSIDCDFDEQDPVGSIRSLLVQPRLKLPLVGKRGDLFTTLRRLFKNARSKTKNGLQGQT